MRVCARLGIPCILENPSRYFLFRAPPIPKIMSTPSCIGITADQCCFGARWRKRTRFSLLNCVHADSLSKLCCGRNGICSVPHRHHIVLQCCSPQGPLWTALALTYPVKLCHTIANILIHSAFCIKQYKHGKICGLHQAKNFGNFGVKPTSSSHLR